MRDDDVCAAIRAAFRTIDPRRAINFAGMAAHVTTGYGNASREPTVRSTGSPGALALPDPPDVLHHARVLRVLYQLDEPTRLLTLAHCHGIGQRRVARWLRLDRDQTPGLALSNSKIKGMVEHGHALVAEALRRSG